MNALMSGLVVTIYLLLRFATVAAVYPARFDTYDWPPEAEEILKAQLELPFHEHYTDQQADDFLANALLYHVREALEKTVNPGPRQRKSGVAASITAATFRPRHILLTDGVEQEVHRRRYVQRWFSLPLLVTDPQDEKGWNYLHVPNQNGQIVRSLDLIRLDSFRARQKGGFWLPTAIVRPYYSPISKSLRFRVIYEFPTSVVRYRSQYRVSPTLADYTLYHTLRRKQNVWLRKLASPDRRLISEMWEHAPRSPFILKSAFFAQPEVSAWSSWPRGPRAEKAVPDLNENYGVDSSSSTEDDLLTPGRARDLASTSAAHGEHEPNALIEHDFFNVPDHRPHQTSPFPWPTPWNGRPAPVPHYSPSSSQWQETRSLDTETGLNLDLSLAAPSTPGSKHVTRPSRD